MAVAQILKKLFGSKADRDMKQLKPILDQILAAYGPIDKLSNDELRAKTNELRAKLRECEAPFEKRIAEIKQKLDEDIPVNEKEALATESDKIVKDEDDAIEKTLNEILPEAFAIMKSTARRFAQNETVEVTATDFDKDLSIKHDFVSIEGDKAIYKNHWMAGGNEITWDMIHYDVQLIGGIVLHQGKIAEMATGEGKTLVATLPVFLNALAGKGVHVVTVNDYLSKRDSEWMGPLYMFHGLSVDCIDKHEPNSDARQRAYNCDITFGTNNEFGFDYLRDNMAVRSEDLVQRKHHYAIVDEVDSVLIDDARTPLIISGPVPKAVDDEQFMEFRPYVESLYNKQRILVTQILNDAKKKITEGDETEGGKLLLRAYKGLPKYQPLIKFLSEPGMKQLLQKTENFYLQDNERQMPQVTDELYFVINEQQHSVDMTDKGHDALAQSVSDPNFFVLPDMGSQIAEIQHTLSLSPEQRQEKKDALMEEYSLKSERVHTVIQLLKAYAMFQKDVDYVIMDNKVKIVDEQTGRIMEGRRWSDGLHQAVEAKENVKVEAATQTFATISLQNYFRMYHKLAGMTGTAETEAGEFWSIYKLDVVVIPTNRPVIRQDLDDQIYKTKKAKYAAVINKVVELTKAGRPVLVGTTDVETSELLSRMLRLRGIKHNVLNAKEHAREAEIVAQAGQTSSVTIATNMAGRGTDIKLSPEVRKAGGLAIIGTERHDSRRVDRQLRGRAGRQGDPGSSEFYVSLEDKLMRLFGSERIAGVVDKLGMKDDEAMVSGMLSKSIENAQRKVEENNFGIRKRLLEYDDVMNFQREAIYARRKNALSGERIEIDVMNMMIDSAALLAQRAEGLSYEEFEELVMGKLSIDLGFTAEEYSKAKEEEISDMLCKHMQVVYKRRMDGLSEKVYPFIKQIYEKQGNMYKFIAIPISDGRKQLTLSVDLEKAYNTEGKEIAKALSRSIILYQIDEHWKQHLRDMDDLRQSVQNAAYEQKDPLVVYKLESYNLFASMLEDLNKDVLSFLLRAFIPLRDTNEAHPAQPPVQRKTDMSQMRTNRNDLSTNGEQKANAPVVAGKKIGRNDPCPCGSGKKYKYCHGRGLV
ncbi:MAG: preprotein translocase subunit SecA [Bacteroidales bacterium]|jgi:preprotein translocase subunit SecA|nr:preprotein translocase subunit SecA [Bacteroidales bacterium]MCH3940250.1 preprotein translocase subunit SecA [Bacteroidales bacterium]MDY6320503.1 preprotein translocase subunit SecA [Bacteroidales bacterium]